MMSMTREEAIKRITMWMYATSDLPPKQVAQALDMALAALRGPTKEQVERMRGEWIRGGYACGEHEWECSKCHGTEWRTTCSRLKFCPFCGAPMTDEAVEILWQRWKEAVV